MVRIRSSYEDYESWSRRRQLSVCRAHRNGWLGERPYGFEDMPIRLTGEYMQDITGTVRDWHGMATPYELQVMMVWGSHKAILGMMMEQDVVEGLGARVALALVKENP